MDNSASLLRERTDEVLNILAHRHCWTVLHYFHRNSTDTATAADLTRFTCKQTQQVTEPSTIETHLHHATLPRLDDVGIIEYDSRSTTAVYRGHPEVDEWLNHLVEQEEISDVFG